MNNIFHLRECEAGLLAKETSPTDASTSLADDSDAGSSSTRRFVDQMTIEYMMNRQYHKQYLAKTNQAKYQEIQEKIQCVDAHQAAIRDMVSELLADYIANGDFTKYNTSVHTSFERFLQECMKYMEDHPAYDDETYQEVEVLFTEPKRSRGGRGRGRG